jgi:hypothetical protein
VPNSETLPPEQNNKIPASPNPEVTFVLGLQQKYGVTPPPSAKVRKCRHLSLPVQSDLQKFMDLEDATYQDLINSL